MEGPAPRGPRAPQGGDGVSAGGPSQAGPIGAVIACVLVLPLLLTLLRAASAYSRLGIAGRLERPG
jgi:hypothetical protein